MEWQPIETYDALAKKPAHAVFRMKGVPPARGGRGTYSLPAVVVMTRVYGQREATHWMPLPPPPEGET